MSDEISSLALQVERLTKASFPIQWKIPTPDEVLRIRSGAPALALVPNGDGDACLENIAEMLSRPTAKMGTITLRERADFVAAVNEHKLPETRIFADIVPSGASFLAIFDFHNPASFPDSAPGLNLFRAAFTLRFSPEWLAWTNALDKFVPSAEFGEFIESREAEFVAPNAATMATLAYTLRGTESCTFTDAVNLANGNVDFAFKRESDVRAGADGSLRVPEEIRIRIPIFLGEEAREFTLKFRYRTKQGHAYFSVSFPTSERVVSDAVKAVREAIAQATSLPVWHGTFAP